MIENTIKKSKLFIQTRIELTANEKISISEMEVNKPYYIYPNGCDQYCDYILFIKDEENCLHLFHAWEKDEKTLSLSEGALEYGPIYYSSIDLDDAKSNFIVLHELFSPKRTLKEMADIMFDLDYMASANDFILERHEFYA